MRIRSLIVTAALGLALAPAAYADTAVEDLYVARDACGGTDPANPRLSLDFGAFTSGCGSLAGFLGGSDTTFTTAAGDGVPVTLDPERDDLLRRLGLAATRAWSSAASATRRSTSRSRASASSPATLAPRRPRRSASGTETTDAATMLRQTDHVYEFDLPIDPARPARTRR